MALIDLGALATPEGFAEVVADDAATVATALGVPPERAAASGATLRARLLQSADPLPNGAVHTLLAAAAAEARPDAARRALARALAEAWVDATCAGRIAAAVQHGDRERARMRGEAAKRARTLRAAAAILRSPGAGAALVDETPDRMFERLNAGERSWGEIALEWAAHLTDRLAERLEAAPLLDQLHAVAHPPGRPGTVLGNLLARLRSALPGFPLDDLPTLTGRLGAEVFGLPAEDGDGEPRAERLRRAAAARSRRASPR